MENENADPEEIGGEGLVSRPPLPEDLVKLCAALNNEGASYIVIGGLAVIEHGFDRATGDIDLLIDSSRENQVRTRKALEVLPDQAVRELLDTDLDEYIVVRVADEVVVDIMLRACGVDFEEAKADISWRILDGVRIPFANLNLLWKTKQTMRDKDQLDRVFIRRLMEEEKSRQEGV